MVNALPVQTTVREPRNLVVRAAQPVQVSTRRFRNSALQL